jgi:hypothetical protein
MSTTPQEHPVDTGVGVTIAKGGGVEVEVAGVRVDEDAEHAADVPRESDDEDRDKHVSLHVSTSSQIQGTLLMFGDDGTVPPPSPYHQ